MIWEASCAGAVGSELSSAVDARCRVHGGKLLLAASLLVNVVLFYLALRLAELRLELFEVECVRLRQLVVQLGHLELDQVQATLVLVATSVGGPVRRVADERG